MRTGHLKISRGHQQAPLAAPPPAAPHVRLVEPKPEPAPPSLDYQLVHDRLSALERLTRLHEQGALSAGEFGAEKAAILRLPAEELVLRAEIAPQNVSKKPTLLGRLFGWHFLLAGLAAGLGFSAYVQPAETTAFLHQIARLAGA